MATDSFQEEFRAYCRRTSLIYTDATDSYKRLDFTLILGRETQFYLELKEKRQPYAMRHWPDVAPESDLFILDDLTVRKCLAYAPRCGVLVRDNLHARYVFFPVVDLALMPRVRVNRAIQNKVEDVKGKWLIDLRNGQIAANLDDATAAIRRYTKNLSSILFEQHACYGEYVGEQIDSAGMTRQPEHWKTDATANR